MSPTDLTCLWGLGFVPPLQQTVEQPEEPPYRLTPEQLIPLYSFMNGRGKMAQTEIASLAKMIQTTTRRHMHRLAKINVVKPCFVGRYVGWEWVNAKS